MRIAVVGGGIAGLSAAWLLGQAHDVTLFEREPHPGGHAHTVDAVKVPNPIAVDTGFVVYNERTYPNLVALFDHLGVATQVSDMSFAVSIDEGALEYGSSGPCALFAQGRNVLRRRFWSMLLGTLRFYRKGRRLLDRADAETLTLGEYLAIEGYSEAFIEDHLLPMAAAIWSRPAGAMRDHPAAAFIRFADDHGLMQLVARPRWRTVSGGSRQYVRKLVAEMERQSSSRLRLATTVGRVHRLSSAVVVEEASGRREAFDYAVIAVHADQALAMLADPTPMESQLLGAFAYSRNRVVLHGDARLMPRRRRSWSSWNFLSDRKAATKRQPCVSYWMNRLHRLDEAPPLFVTLNPAPEPRTDLLRARFRYDHPGFDAAALAAQRQLPSIQGARRTWFCGSYFGAGFHEDALVSGLAAAEALGDVCCPWRPKVVTTVPALEFSGR